MQGQQLNWQQWYQTTPTGLPAITIYARPTAKLTMWDQTTPTGIPALTIYAKPTAKLTIMGEILHPLIYQPLLYMQSQQLNWQCGAILHTHTWLINIWFTIQCDTFKLNMDHHENAITSTGMRSSLFQKRWNCSKMETRSAIWMALFWPNFVRTYPVLKLKLIFLSQHTHSSIYF